MKPVVLKKALVDETLAAEPEEGKHPLNPFTEAAKTAGANITLLEITKDESRAEVHRGTIDFFYCLEGEIEFITGGELVEPFLREYEDGTVNDLEVRAPKIAGGEVEKLEAGDMIWIPNGLPHSNRTDSHARLLVLKIPANDIFPLENVSGWKK